MLHNLQKRQDIIINPADKGGAVVLWYWDHYTKEAAKQMAEMHYFKMPRFGFWGFFSSRSCKVILEHKNPYKMYANYDEIKLGKMPEFTGQILGHPTMAGCS